MGARRILQFLCSFTTHRFPEYYEEPWAYAIDNPFAPDALRKVVTCTRCGWYNKKLVADDLKMKVPRKG